MNLAELIASMTDCVQVFVCLTNLASGVQVGSAFKSASLAAILAPLLHCICVMPRSALTPATILRVMSKSVVIRH